MLVSCRFYVSSQSTPHLTFAISRPDIGDEVVKRLKGAARFAVVALAIAAQTTQNVPYLGAISTALTEFMKIQDVRRHRGTYRVER